MRVDAGDSVTVVGVEQPTPPTPPARRWPPSRLGWVAAVLVAVLLLLLLLPTEEPPPVQPLGEGEVPAPADSRLLPWPGRGPWASDDDFVAEAAAAWRDAAQADPSIEPPGDEVVPLWAGPVSGAVMALLQSVGSDGAVRVAQVSDMLYGWLQPDLRLLAATRVDSEPEFVTFAFVGPDDRRGQLDPDVLSTFQMLPGPPVASGERRVLRVEGRRFVPVDLQEGGLSAPWAYGRWWIRDEPEIAVVVDGEDDTLLSVVRLDPDALLPDDPPITLTAPDWGADGPYEPADYLVASTALESVGLAGGETAVLGSTTTAAGHASLVQVRPEGSVDATLVAVFATDDEVTVSPPRPLAPDAQVALGAVRTPGGDLLVVAAASPQTTLLSIDLDGEVVATGGRVQAAVVESGTDATVVGARAFQEDTSVPERTAVDVEELGAG